MKNISRRTAVKTLLAGGAAMAVSGMDAAVLNTSKAEPLKGNIGVSAAIRWKSFARFVRRLGLNPSSCLTRKIGLSYRNTA